MLERIVKTLEKLEIATWRVTRVESHTAELYFIRKRLDMPRIKQLTEYKAEVFRDFEKDGKALRGTMDVMLTSDMTDGEISEKLQEAYAAARYTGNPVYELADPVQAPCVTCTTALAALTPEEAAERMAEAMFSADTAEDAFLNSAELFVTKTNVHILAGNGLDVAYDKATVWGEMVAQCVTPCDVEQYRGFAYDDLNTDALREKALEAIADVRARACTTEMPKSGKYDVLLTGEHIRTVLDYYQDRSGVGMVYPGYSDWKPGSPAQGEEINGEKLNLTLVPTDPFSDEGIPMRRRTLLENGTLKTIHGPTRLCRYLQVEPTGTYEKICCDNGTAPYAGMTEANVLEPISFSDFQMDSMDGHFKGEIRLARLHLGNGRVKYVTGGSINGSLPEGQRDLVFSLERYEDSRYSGPKAMKVRGVMVAGA